MLSLRLALSSRVRSTPMLGTFLIFLPECSYRTIARDMCRWRFWEDFADIVLASIDVLNA
jgi:hypothetical protein